MFDRFDRDEIEEMILGMAEVVYENRELRRKLQEAEEYKKKYDDLLNQNVKEAGERSAALLDAIMSGAFTGITQQKEREEMMTKPTLKAVAEKKLTFDEFKEHVFQEWAQFDKDDISFSDVGFAYVADHFSNNVPQEIIRYNYKKGCFY